MEINPEKWLRGHHKMLDTNKLVYESTKAITCPYFKSEIALTSDGFNHLLNKSNRVPRNIREQNLKVRLLPKALQILRVAGTVQEYRTSIEKFGHPAKDGFSKTKQVQYWAFHDLLFGTEHKYLIRVIVRKVGDGKHHFWSVMQAGKDKLYKEGIEDS
jgi:hypothetical protein